MNKFKQNKKLIDPVEALPGIFRRTLFYNENIMLCHFFLKKGSEVPLHSHKEHQVGYVIKGKLKFITNEQEFITEAGDSYIFGSDEKHGASILEDSEVIDVFTPSREDYK